MQKWLRNFAVFGSHVGELSTQPYPPRGSRRWRGKQKRVNDPCVLMANMKAICLHNHCCLAGQQGGDETKRAHGPLAMMGAHTWANGLYNPYHLGGTGSGDGSKAGYMTRAL